MSDYNLAPKSIVDELAQFIRKVDGNNRMGAGALADKICERFHVAAPAVQGEPVGEVRLELGSPSYIFAELYSKSLSVLTPGTKLYAAPQPAEQQSLPCKECGGDGAGGEHEEDCVMAQITPDVAALVEALERLVGDVERATHVEFGGTPWLKEKMAEIDYARAALAAHRKQGGGV